MTPAAGTRAHPELDLQRQIVGTGGLASIFGWDHVHFRPALTKHGWRTPGSGTLAKGWPDLLLVRGRDRRLIFAELKANGGKPTLEQSAVLEVLMALEDDRPGGYTNDVSVEVYIWRPADLDEIARILR